MLPELNQVAKAALELQTVLEGGNFPFCFIGGLTVQRWGQPRMTRDADATVLTRFLDDERLVDFLLEAFVSRRPDSREFALRNRVLLLQAKNEVNLDVALGALDFEQRSIDRASIWDYATGLKLKTCSAEDLLVYKAFAGRDIDWMDVDGVLIRQGAKLNIPQIFDELRPLVALKEDASILPKLETLMRKRGILIS